MIRWIIRITMLVFILGIASVNIGSTEPNKEKVTKHTTQAKEVQGEATFISKRYISVLYNRDEKKGEEYEVLFLLPADEKDIKLQNLGQLGDLAKGDIVKVQYDEDRTQYESKREEKKLVVKVISFIRKAGASPAPNEEGVLKSR